MRNNIEVRQGQSLIELLVAIGVGAILIIAAVSVIVPALLINRQVTPIQTGVALGAELLNNVRAWSEGDWHNVLALATGTGNPYYLSATSSPFLAVTSASSSAGWPNGYAYRRTITIDHSQVASSDQLSFPVLVSGQYGFLAASSSGGNVQNGNGYDILFTSDASGTAPMPFEVESYASSNGTLVAWVRVATLSYTVDTPIYLFYGNSAITLSPANPTAVWDGNYKGVWHLPNGTTLSLLDSTVHHNGTNQGVVATPTGLIDGGGSFSSAYIDLSNTGDYYFNGTNPFTVSAWFKATSLAGSPQIVSRFNGGVLGNWDLSITSSKLIVEREISPWTLSGNTVLSINTWYYGVLSYDGTKMYVYLNGLSDATPVASGNIGADQSNLPVYIGADRVSNNPTNYFPGVIDETRISNVARSGGWIKTEYNNQSNPGGFYNMGGAMTPSGGVGNVGETLTINTSTYSRYFYLSDVYRSGGAIVTSGGTYDPSTKFVTVVYQLPSGATSSLSAYLTRHGQAIYDQSDWSGGGGADGPATTTNSRFSTSSGVSFSTTTGSIYATIPGY